MHKMRLINIMNLYKPKSVNIIHCRTNDKYDLFIDTMWCGKYYTVEEACEAVERYIFIQNEEQKFK